MTSVLVCVPTVPGRQPYLVNAARSYERSASRTGAGARINFSVVTDARSAGEGWQRCLDQGLGWWPETTHVHLSNDDVCVADGWLTPLLRVCCRDLLPAMRIEPAGAHVGVEEIDPACPPMPPRYPYGVPRTPNAYFFAGLPEEQPRESLIKVDHANLPFLSVSQLRDVGRIPPIHYGTDRWVAERARTVGLETVSCAASVAFNYNALAGRHRGDWTEQDFAAFDGVFALPAYLAGVLRPDQPHPLRETDEGLACVRSWRRGHETNVWDPDLQTDEGRLRLLGRVLER